MGLGFAEAWLRPVSNCQMLGLSATNNEFLRSVHFPGAVNSKFTTRLEFERPSAKPAMPTYRVVDQDGAIVDKSATAIDISDAEVLKLYKDMLTGGRTWPPPSLQDVVINGFSQRNGFDHV